MWEVDRYAFLFFHMHNHFFLYKLVHSPSHHSTVSKAFQASLTCFSHVKSPYVCRSVSGNLNLFHLSIQWSVQLNYITSSFLEKTEAIGIQFPQMPATKAALHISIWYERSQWLSLLTILEWRFYLCCSVFVYTISTTLFYLKTQRQQFSLVFLLIHNFFLL